MLQSCGISDSGLVRKSNEDGLVSIEDMGLFVVADGMGGHSAGEVASRLALEAVEGFIRRSHGECDFSWPYGIDTALSLDGNRLKTAIHLANRRVFRAAESRDDYTGMGTTVVAALVSPGRVVVGNVGDSRLYLLSGGVLRQVTQDDTWVATVLAYDPQTAPEALARHPMRHVLTSVVGARDQVESHVAELPLAAGDMLLLCSDGLHGVLDDSAIEALLRVDAPVDSIAQSLIAAALEHGGPDNVTVVVVRSTGD